MKRTLFINEDDSRFTSCHPREDMTHEGIDHLIGQAVAACRHPGARDALAGDQLKAHPFKKWFWRGERIYQFDESRGIAGFPRHPADVLESYEAGGVR